MSILRHARDLAQLAGAPEIEVVHVIQAAEQLGIDERGLDRVDRQVLKILIRRGRPVGARSLAARVGVDLETYLNVATQKARELYGEPAVR